MVFMVLLIRVVFCSMINLKLLYEMSVMYLLLDIVYVKLVSSGLLCGGRRLESCSSGSDGLRKRFFGGIGFDKKEVVLIKGSVLLCVVVR